MNKMIILLIVSFFISGCASLIEYTPNSIDNFEQAKKDIEFALYNQVKHRIPTAVNVTDDYLLISGMVYKRHLMNPDFVQTTSHEQGLRLYYKHLNSFELYQKRDYFPVFVYDKDSYIAYRGYFKSEATAKLFIDSLYTLKCLKEGK